MYWTANNVMSIMQTLALKHDSLRNYFDIPAMPKAEDVPALKMVNPFRRVVEVSISSKPLIVSSKPSIVSSKSLIVSSKPLIVSPKPLIVSPKPSRTSLNAHDLLKICTM